METLTKHEKADQTLGYIKCLKDFTKFLMEDRSREEILKFILKKNDEIKERIDAEKEESELPPVIQNILNNFTTPLSHK